MVFQKTAATPKALGYIIIFMIDTNTIVQNYSSVTDSLFYIIRYIRSVQYIEYLQHKHKETPLAITIRRLWIFMFLNGVGSVFKNSYVS